MRSLFFVLFLQMAYHVYSQNTNPAPLPLEPKFVYEDCGCKINVELTIHYGLYGNYGGQAVKKNDKWVKGAVTVANKNNTNGDFDALGNEIIDNTQNPVIATSRGRDEIDLMALKIDVSGPRPECPGDNVILDYKGNISFWDSPTKNNKINTLSLAISSLPKTVWIEAIDVSTKVRDIEIYAYINTIIPDKEKDKVRATAIWCEKLTSFYRDAGNLPLSRVQLPRPESIGIDNLVMRDIINIQNYWNPDMTRYGYGYFGEDAPSPSSPKLFGGRILFSFITYPTGISAEFGSLNIEMDISRRITSFHKHMATSGFLIDDFESPSSRLELPNDDPEDPGCPLMPGTSCDALDEDPTPTSNSVFSYDSPGYVIDGFNTNYAVGIYKADFNEYCRVSFKDDIKGEIEEGSKCSNFIDWKINFVVANTKILDSSDPYNREKQELEVVKSSGNVITLPTLFSGSGNGDITIIGLGSPSGGYYIEFEPSTNRWKVIYKTTGFNWGEYTTVGNLGVWEFNKPGYINLKIEDNKTIKFSNDCRFGFNVCNLSNLDIIEEFEVK